MKNIICFLLVTLSFSMFTSAQTDTTPDQNQRIEALEKEIQELQGSRPFLHWQDYLGVGVLVTAIVGLVGFYFKKSIEAAKEKELAALSRRLSEFEQTAQANIKLTQEKIIEAINADQALFRKISEAADLENILKKTKRIYIAGETPDSVIRLLKNAKFLRKNIIVDDTDGADFDIYFINNEHGSLDLKEYVEKVNNLPDSVHVFYYCTKHGVFFPTTRLPYEKRDRVNFATNPAQVYGNLINTLKYQHEVLKD